VLIQGECDPKFGPVVRVAVRSANVRLRRRAVFVWVNGLLREDESKTLVSKRLIDDLWLWDNRDIRIVSLLFRGEDGSTWALFRDLPVGEIDPFLTPCHRRFHTPDVRIDVVIGQDVIGRSDLVQYADTPEPEEAGFVFHVDTETGILPVRPAE